MQQKMPFSQSFLLDGKPVGDGHPAYVIAEAGVAHFGSEEKAYRLVDMAVDAGADAVKFQIFDVDELIAKTLPEWRRRLRSRQLPYEAFERIQQYCKEKAITFFATAHDYPSLDFLTSLNVPLYKVGSGEVGNLPYLRAIASLGKPLIFSVGMYTLDQIEQAIEVVRQTDNRDVAVLHCVTRYPTPPLEAALGNITLIRARFGLVTGYSDHTQGFHLPLAAVALGSRIIEKHISLDFNVPDAQDWKVSCGPHDLAQFVQQLREIEAALGVRTSGPTDAERESLIWASKSLVPTRDIRKGEAIRESDLVAKRPGNGISPSDVNKVVGRVAVEDIAKDQAIKWEQFA
ncbi:N-acetylneuraminate synthase family protein [Polaromonas sp.]|uniref:N-acetylneuraminate synthase family protein n=1 Tax=Polaromonas sp. TaxID=1869339 RepID=UPI0025D470AE|nr:N-acetylneuraminate synthase family protein [Polaromonas sp.]